MKVRVFTLRLDPATGRFDDRDLVEFQDGREVLEVSEYQFTHERTPTWAILVRYRDGEAPGRRRDGDARKDWRADLDVPARGLYDHLRDWRARRAHRDGMPPYLVLTNRELAAVAARRPASKEALGLIQGIGDSKVERFGAEVLAIVSAAATADYASVGESSRSETANGA